MRMIERKMLAAIHERKDWHLDNTEVQCVSLPACNIDKVFVRLHGNTIAMITPTEVDVCDCGWQTPTTKSRLNAILYELCGAGIYQKQHKWYGCAVGAQDWEIQRGSRQVFYRGQS